MELWLDIVMLVSILTIVPLRYQTQAERFQKLFKTCQIKCEMTRFNIVSTLKIFLSSSSLHRKSIHSKSAQKILKSPLIPSKHIVYLSLKLDIAFTWCQLISIAYKRVHSDVPEMQKLLNESVLSEKRINMVEHFNECKSL